MTLTISVTLYCLYVWKIVPRQAYDSGADSLAIPQHSSIYLSMDFIEGLPNSNGYSAILVIVDKFTKYSHFYPLKHPFTATLSSYMVFLTSSCVVETKSSLANFGLSSLNF
jgi:hypothetical protein